MKKARLLPRHVEIVLALLMKSTRPLPPRVEIVLVVMLKQSSVASLICYHYWYTAMLHLSASTSMIESLFDSCSYTDSVSNMALNKLLALCILIWKQCKQGYDGVFQNPTSIPPSQHHKETNHDKISVLNGLEKAQSLFWKQVKLLTKGSGQLSKYWTNLIKGSMASYECVCPWVITTKVSNGQWNRVMKTCYQWAMGYNMSMNIMEQRSWQW